MTQKGLLKRKSLQKRKKDGKENIFFKNSGLIQFTTTYDNGKKMVNFEYNKEQKIITILIIEALKKKNNSTTLIKTTRIWKDFHDNGKIKKYFFSW